MRSLKEITDLLSRGKHDELDYTELQLFIDKHELPYLLSNDSKYFKHKFCRSFAIHIGRIYEIYLKNILKKKIEYDESICKNSFVDPMLLLILSEIVEYSTDIGMTASYRFVHISNIKYITHVVLNLKYKESFYCEIINLMIITNDSIIFNHFNTYNSNSANTINLDKDSSKRNETIIRALTKIRRNFLPL